MSTPDLDQTTTPAVSPHWKRRRFGRRVLFSFVLLLLGLEGALRIAHEAAFARVVNEVSKPPAEGAWVITCLGDSHTFGMGADNPRTESYPARLEALLRGRLRTPIAVVNRGKPGWNSSQVREDLPKAIEETRPRVVLLLSGENDHWNLSESDVVAPEDEGVFVSLDRLLQHSRLYKFARYHLSRPAPAQLPLLKPDADVPDPLRNFANSPVHDPWNKTPPKDFSRRRKCKDAMAAFSGAIRRQRPDRALAALDEFQRILGRDEPGVRVLRADCYIVRKKPGDLERARDILEALERDYPEMPGYTSRLAIVLSQMGREDEARKALKRYFAHGVIGHEAYHMMDWARDVGMGKDVDALRERVRDKYPSAVLQAFFKERASERKITPAVQVAWDRVRIANERRMVRVAQARGVLPVLLTYPRRPPSPWLRARRKDLGVLVIDASKAFRGIITSKKREQYFVPDGHCNSRGYRLMAKVIAEGLEENGVLPP